MDSEVRLAAGVGAVLKGKAGTTLPRPRSGEDLETAWAKCAEANAAAHWERWDVKLPTGFSASQVRLDWAGATRSEVSVGNSPFVDPRGSAIVAVPPMLEGVGGPASPGAIGQVADGQLPTLSIRRGEHWVRVHSARRPMDEARQFVQQELGDRTPEVVCVIGAGLGYVVDVLLERGDTKVLVLEPEPASIPWLLGRRDWRDAIASARLLIVPGPEYEQRMSAWLMLTPVPETVPFLGNRVICETYPAAAQAARDALRLVMQNAVSNRAAGERFERVMLLNTLRNLPVIAREAPVDALLAAFPHKPAVLAGAGPSLNRNIEELRPYRDRCVLIAVGTALKPLLAAGMPPDFVVAVDPGEFTPLQFAGVEAPSTYLVADPCVSPEIFAGFEGRTFLFRLGKHEPWPWLLEQGYDPGVIRSWGSVITTALHLGVKLGCDPLVFIGTDLAHAGDRTHAEGTALHVWVQEHVANGGDELAAWSAIRDGAKVLMEPGLQDRFWPTTDTMCQFRDWLRHESTVLPMRFVNATGAGILTGGRIESWTLESALGRVDAIPRRQRTATRVHERSRQHVGQQALMASIPRSQAVWTAGLEHG